MIRIDRFHLLLLISVITTALLLFLVFKEKSNNTSAKNQIVALTDTVHHYKTKDNKNAAQIAILKGSKSEILRILETKDKEILDLVKKTKNIVTITKINTVTRVDTIAKVDTLFIRAGDSVLKDSIYITKFIKNDYYTADIKIINDSVALKLDVKNDFKIITKEKPNGLFKPKTLVIEVINENPYTYTTDLSSFEITPKKKIIPKALVIGAAIIGGILILK